MKVKHFTCPSGDWEALVVNGKLFEDGHSIPTSTWLELLKDSGCFVSEHEISNDKMEQQDYTVEGE